MVGARSLAKAAAARDSVGGLGSVGLVRDSRELRGSRAGMADSASGACGAVLCVAAGLPFDTAKARMQAKPHKYTNLLQTITHIAKVEKPKSLYSGAMPALASALTENVVGITAQRALARNYAKLQNKNHKTHRNTPTEEVALGAATGFFTSIAICPAELLKVRLQILGTNTGLLHAARQIFTQDGISGFFRGIGPLICRDVPFNALFYGTYESLITFMLRSQEVQSRDELGTGSILMAGGLAGCCGWSFVLPMDVTKTRLQAGSARGTFFQVVSGIVIKEGIGALFSGWTAAVMRAFPANAGLFLGVEYSSRFFAWCRRADD